MFPDSLTAVPSDDRLAIARAFVDLIAHDEAVPHARFGDDVAWGGWGVAELHAYPYQQYVTRPRANAAILPI